MPNNASQPIISIQDRLAVGNLTISEVCSLAGRSRTAFYSDVKLGFVEIIKRGRRSLVAGPVAMRYISGTAIPTPTQGNDAPEKRGVQKAS